MGWKNGMCIFIQKIPEISIGANQEYLKILTAAAKTPLKSAIICQQYSLYSHFFLTSPMSQSKVWVKIHHQRNKRTKDKNSLRLKPKPLRYFLAPDTGI